MLCFLSTCVERGVVLYTALYRDACDGAGHGDRSTVGPSRPLLRNHDTAIPVLESQRAAPFLSGGCRLAQHGPRNSSYASGRANQRPRTRSWRVRYLPEIKKGRFG